MATNNQDQFLNIELNYDNIDRYYIRTSIKKSIEDNLANFQGVFLDLGCGEMPYKEYILSNSNISKYIGMDIENPTYQKNILPDIFWDGKQIPLEDNSIDTIMATEVFEHVPNLDEILKEIYRVLKPTGKLFFTVPFLWPLHDVPYDEYRYTPFSLERHFKKAGFENIEIKALGGWNASLAQMIGLWLKRSGLSDSETKKLFQQLFPFYKELLETDKIPSDFKKCPMITSIGGSAKKKANTTAILENKDKTKVVVIVHMFPKLSETFILDQIVGLVKANIDFEIWAISNANESITHSTIFEYNILERTKYIKLPSNKLNSSLWTSEFLTKNNINNLENTVFHVHFGPNFLRYTKLFQTIENPVFVSFHGYDASNYIKQNGANCYDYLFARANSITTPSYEMQNVLVNIGCDKNKMIIHRYGVDTNKLSPINHKLNTQNDKIRLLTIGRFVEKKGIEDSIKAVAKLQNDNIIYTIIGEGDLEKTYKSLVSELGLEKVVNFVGSKSKEEILDYFANTDIFILPSVIATNGDKEGLPVSLIEAQSCGLPVISTYHSGIPELVTNNETGFLSKEKDVNSIAKNLNILIQNPELRAKFGENGRQKVLDEFDIEVLNERLQGYYRDLLNKEIKDEIVEVKDKNKPLMSIIVPNHNNEQYIDMCIQSVLNQTEKNWELIIVDDASTDNSVARIQKYLADKRIKLIQHISNKQIGQTTIDGILNSTSEIFGTLDGDDCLAQDAVAEIVKSHKEHPNAGMIYSQFVYCDENLNPKRIGYCGPIPIGKTNLDSDKVSHFKTFKRKFYDKTIGYEATINCAVDKDIAYKMEEVGELFFLDKPLYLYRVKSTSISHKPENTNNLKDTLNRVKINAIQRRNHIAFNKNQKAINYFENAQSFFNQNLFSEANSQIEKYKTLIDYNSFVKIDNRNINSPKLSIVIVTYNAKLDLIKCIYSIKQQLNNDTEIIIIDNGKNDEVLHHLINEKLLYVRCPINFILSEGRNIGVNYAQGDIIAFLDDDAIAEENWIKNILQDFQNYDIVALRGKVLPKNPDAFIITKPHYNLGDEPLFVNYIQTEGNSAVKKDVFKLVGGMNPLLFGGEGFDLSTKISQTIPNSKILYSPNIIIYHDYATTEDKNQTKKERYKRIVNYLNYSYSFDPEIMKGYHKLVKEKASNSKISEKSSSSLRILYIAYVEPKYKQLYNKIAGQVQALRENGAKVDAFIIGKGESLVGNDFPFTIINLDEIKAARHFIVEQLIIKFQPNYVYFRYPNGYNNALEPLIPLAEKYKNFYFEHNTKEEDELRANEQTDLLQQEINFGRLIITKAAGLIGMTNSFSEHQKKRVPNLQTPIITIANGITINNYTVSTKPILSDRLVLLFVGYIAIHHGIERLLYSIANYKGNTKISLLIVGKFFNSEYENTVRELVKTLNLVEQVHFLGELSKNELNKYYDESHICIGSLGMHLINSPEGASLKTREYISRGKPIIIDHKDTDIPDNVDFVYRATPDSSPIDIEELIRFYKNIKSTPQDIRRFAEENLDWKMKMKKLIDFMTNTHSDMLNASSEIKSSQSLVSIIIPVYNKVELTKQCIKSIFENTQYSNYEIIIVNNASTDGTDDYLNELVASNKRIRVVNNDKNLGYAKATNQGAKLAKGKFLVLLNNDTIPLAGWLTNLVNSIDSNSKIGIVGAKLLYPDDTIQHCGVALRRDRKWFKHPYKFVERNHPLVNNLRKWDAVTAACLITHTELFFKLGMLDEYYLNGCEDIDYCCKVREAGYEIYYEPIVELYHLESQSERINQNENDSRNFDYFIAKWGNNAIKTELDIFVEDDFWEISGNKYIHKYNELVNEWKTKLDEAIKQNNQAEAQRLNKLFKHLYTVKEWNYDIHSLSRPVNKISFNYNTHSPNAHLVAEQKSLIIPSSSSSTPRVLFICHDFPPYRYAGAQLFAKNLAQEINKTGKAQVEILYPQFRDKNKQDYSITQTTFEDLTIYELNRPKASEINKMFDENALKSLYSFLKNNHYDLIHIHGLGHITQAIVYAADKLNIKMIMTLHDFWFICSNWHLVKRNDEVCTGPESIEKCAKCYLMNNSLLPDTPENYEKSFRFHTNREDLFRDAYAKISHLYAPSNYLKSVFNTYGYDNISVLNNGLSFSEPAQNTKQYNTNSKLIIGYAGQIIKRKGVHILLEAFKQIHNKNIELHIWGKNDAKNEYNRKIKELIESDSRIKYFGEYNNTKINEIISTFDIMVIPSLMDNYPITIQEAFNNKIPAIASKVGGITEMISDGINGLLFEVSSVPSLVEALNRVIENPQLIDKFKENIPDIKSLETNANEYLKEYSKFIPNFKFVLNTKKIETPSIKQKGSYIVQFYIYKSVHWSMFKDYIEYLSTQSEVREIVLCLPNIGNLSIAGKYDLVDEIFNLAYKIVTNPQDANADITYIADTIAGKVYGCGYIVNLGHGTISKGYYFTESVWTERENWVDLLCVPGNYAKSKFDKMLATNVVATGMPKLDKVFRKQYDKKSLCDSLNFDISKPIILYAPTFNKDLSSIYDFVDNFHKINSNDYYVLIKLHGSTNYELIERFREIARRSSNIIFIEDSNIAPYIGGADLLISDVSSVFMEFMALDKPVILYDNPNRGCYHGYNPQNIEYEWRDLGTRVNSFDELLQVMPDILKFGDNKSQIRQNYAKELFADLDGKASINVWNETKELLTSHNKPKQNDVLSLIIELSPDLLPFVRSELQNLQFYSVMPIEIVFVTNDKEQLNRFFDELNFSNEFYKIKIVEQNPNIDPIIQGFQAAEGDYIGYFGNGVSIYKNYDYIIYHTFKLNDDKIAFTGLTNSQTNVLNYEKYISNNSDENLSRHAYNFINKYQCKETKLVDNIFELPQLLVIKKGTINFHNYNNYSELVHSLVNSHKLYVNLSLFYHSLPEKLITDITKVWREKNKFTFQDRIKTFSDVLQYVVLSEIAEVLIKDMLSINYDKNELINTVYQSLYSRYYDLDYKEELLRNFSDIPNLNQYLSENIRILRKLKELNGKSKCKIISYDNNQNLIAKIVENNKSENAPKVLFYFFKNVHIPILEPIYSKLKATHPEAQIAFGYMSYAPQIRAGFTQDEFELLKAFGENLYNNPQDFNPDITFIADSCYEFVQNCGLLIHVGHGILSKGQYYTDTALARREEYADLVCVPGEHHKKILNNIISKPVVATGMAKLDSLYDGAITKKRIISQLGLNSKHKYILFAPTFNDELSAIPFIKDRINEVIPDNNTFLIIKLHGSTKQEYKDMYRKIFMKDARAIYVEDLNIAPYLALADIMISDVSSAMIEFASLDKPLILFNNPNWTNYKHYNPNDIEFKWRDIGIQVNNLEEMKQAVVRSFNNPNEFSQKRIYYTSQLIANKSQADASIKIINSAFELLNKKLNRISGVKI